MTSFHMGFRVRSPSGTVPVPRGRGANKTGTLSRLAPRKCSDPPHALATAYVWVFFLLVFLAGCGSSWKGSVGAILGKDNRSGRVFVRQAPPGMGAARAGVAEGDEV